VAIKANPAFTGSIIGLDIPKMFHGFSGSFFAAGIYECLFMSPVPSIGQVQRIRMKKL
jgi:hypothetical protein